MSVYYPSFNYLGINSREKNLIVTHFDGGDNGEVDTFLGMEPIYTDNSDGTRRIDYGAKFKDVAIPMITVMKQDGGVFSVSEIEGYLKWLTGSRKVSPLDLVEHFEDEFTCEMNKLSFVLHNQADMIYAVYINESKLDESKWKYDALNNTLTLLEYQLVGNRVKVVYNKIKFSFIGRVTNMWHYKMDARTIGLVIEFTSISPWAISPTQTVSCQVNGASEVTIPNMSDDVDTYVYMKTTYHNKKAGSSLVLTNKNTNEKTEVKNLAINEVVTIEGNQIITSDKSSRIFGNDFNFNFPRLISGDNTYDIMGTGTINFKYRVPLKVGDCAIDLNAKTDPICDDSNNILIDTLDWSRISNTPTTASGYGLTDVYTVSAVYNKNEINEKIDEISDKVDSTASLISTVSSELSNDYYNKIESDSKFYDKDEIEREYYKKSKVDEKVDSLNIDIKSNASVISAVASDLTNNYYNKSNIEKNYYSKQEIDNITYTQKEVDKKIDSLTSSIKSNASLISTISSELSNDYYDKTEIDDIISGLSYTPPSDSGGDGSSVMWGQITGKPTTLAGYKIKEEVQDLIDKSVSSVKIDIDEDELNQMLAEVLGD